MLRIICPHTLSFIKKTFPPFTCHTDGMTSLSQQNKWPHDTAWYEWWRWSFMFCCQTQEVQKAMDEKKFEEAVRLRGRYSLTSTTLTWSDISMCILSKIQLYTDKFIRQVSADRELAALNRFITFPTSSSEALCDIHRFHRLQTALGLLSVWPCALV